MTRDDINRMAWKAGKGQHTWEGTLEDFARLVAAAEREACAKLCEQVFDEAETPAERSAAEACAYAIRARGGDA